MKIVFVSNYLNHHQLPFCLALFRLTNNEFSFVATEKTPVKRIQLGYADMNNMYSFIIREYEADGKEAAKKAMLNADVCLLGSCSFEHHQWLRRARKTYFMETERFFKGTIPWPIRFLKRTRYFFRYSLYRKNYLLCMSAYTYQDMLSFGAFRNRAFRFGYFPPMEKFDNFPAFFTKKEKNLILWVGRFLPLKHPEFMVRLALILKNNHLPFRIEMVGNGPEWESIQKSIIANSITEYVSLIGSIPSDEVRAKMKSAQFFCFTSDSNEGWGAVCNEAMNSGCIVIGNALIGSVPYLIKDGVNGFVYTETFESFLEAFFRATAIPSIEKIASAAYETIVTEWNAEIAATRFLSTATRILEKKTPPFYPQGPLSPETIHPRK